MANRLSDTDVQMELLHALLSYACARLRGREDDQGEEPISLIRNESDQETETEHESFLEAPGRDHIMDSPSGRCEARSAWICSAF